MRLKKILPSASKELDGLVFAARGIEAGVNAKNIAVIITYYRVLLDNFKCLLPKLSQYPTIKPVLLSNIDEVEELIRGLSDGTATIHDVNESNKKFAKILEKTIPK